VIGIPRAAVNRLSQRQTFDIDATSPPPGRCEPTCPFSLSRLLAGVKKAENRS